MKIEGVKEAKADYRRNWAWAKYNPAQVNPEKLVEVLNANTKFKASLPAKDKNKPR